MSFIVQILFIAIVLFVLYIVITIAVRDGINRSYVGMYLEKTHSQMLKRKSALGKFLEDDLDN